METYNKFYTYGEANIILLVHACEIRPRAIWWVCGAICHSFEFCAAGGAYRNYLGILTYILSSR
jgi:hypothetical protein